MNTPHIITPEDTLGMVTLTLNQQRFGIPVEFVRDVMKDQHIAPIPMAPADIAGAINLRGRIVTVIDMRKRLSMPETYPNAPYYIVVDHKGEYFCLMVDKVSEILRCPVSDIEENPANLEHNIRDIAQGICQLSDDLLVVMDIHKVLEI
jgi:purine-binding chemotaxis protein CheW